LYEAARRGAVLEERIALRASCTIVTQQLFSDPRGSPPCPRATGGKGRRRATMMLDPARTALAEMRSLSPSW
jgi:hypothetical protein